MAAAVPVHGIGSAVVDLIFSLAKRDVTFFSATVKAFVVAVISGELLPKVWVSIKVLLVGYAGGVAIAALLTTF